MKNWAATGYPDLYKHCYWGAFTGEHEQEIITNRNTFSAERGLVSWCRANAPFDLMHNSHVRDGFDHNEAYRDAVGGIICLTSPYKSNQPELPDWAMEYFVETYPLYSASAVSYVAHFKDILAVRAAIKFVKSLRSKK